jgi:hypothetical protein
MKNKVPKLALASAVFSVVQQLYTIMMKIIIIPLQRLRAILEFDKTEKPNLLHLNWMKKGWYSSTVIH